MRDEAGPDLRDVGLGLGAEAQPEGKRREDVRVLVAGKEGRDLRQVEVVRGGGQDGGEDLRAARVEEQGVPMADDEVLVGIDDRIRLLRITRQDDPLMLAVVKDHLR
ncbi:hypothetical protein D3C86_1498280 [compost metagenome]